jgi:acyl-CoA thioesterase
MDMETLKGLVDPELYGCLDNLYEMCNTPYAVKNEIELVSASKKIVVMRKKVVPHDLNSNGVVHGATTFGIVDHAFAVIGNMDYRSVGLSCNINYHRPCFGGVLEAEARLVNESRSLMAADIAVYCDGKLIATANCIGFKAEKPKK